ncbi:MAG: hypothetical protein LBM99_01750 [Bacillales bacterium]|nr:hypothetical protein [Bacillales bacterium]
MEKKKRRKNNTYSKKDLNSRFYSGFHSDKKVVMFKDIKPCLQKLRLPKQYLKAIRNK